MRLTEFLRAPEPCEPVGIVIADGGRGNALPRLAAFVWGPVPEPEEELVLEDSREVLAALA